MAEPTLSEVFGPNATQDATTVTLAKADLTGLTAAASNTAESILAALVLRWSQELTEAKRQADLTGDRQVTALKLENAIFTDATDTEILLSPFSVQFYREFSSPEFDPDNY